MGGVVVRQIHETSQGNFQRGEGGHEKDYFPTGFLESKISKMSGKG